MINPSLWLSFKPKVRTKLAELFNLTKSSGVVVFNNQIECDGYTPKDLMGITDEKLTEILSKGQGDVPKDFFTKLEYLVADIETLLEGKKIQYDVADTIKIADKVVKKKYEKTTQNKKRNSSGNGKDKKG